LRGKFDAPAPNGRAGIRHCHGCPFGSRPVVVANRYTLNRSLNHTHDHRLTVDSPA
jgi:hypothetical protein